MTKQEILDYFKEINYMYNNPNMYDSLSHMIDELLEEEHQKGYTEGWQECLDINVFTVDGERPY